MSPTYKNFIYDEERGFIFAYVPKVACTNWKSLMRQMAGHEDWLDNKLAHDKVNGGLRYLDLDGPDAALLNDPTIRKYAMVRDPYSRTLSAYLNKVEGRLPPKPKTPGEDHFDKVVRDIEAFRKTQLDPAKFPEINFEAFLLWLKDSGSWYAKDEHWAPQSVLLRQPGVDFDFIGRFENLTDDAAHILKEMGSDVGFPSQKDVKFAPTAANTKVDRYLTPTTSKILETYFLMDFELYHYSQSAERFSYGSEENREMRNSSQDSFSTFISASKCGPDASLQIQAAINAAVLNGGGCVSLSAGTFTITKSIVLYSKIILKGQGAGTVLRLADNVNAPVVETERFDELSGSNSWFALRENVPIAFGLESLTIDGNWEMNKLSPGVRFFGKRYTVRDVAIRETSGVGFYSECGNQVGQDGPDDMPECIVDGLWISKTRGHGIQFRGPHDGILNNILVSRARGKGIWLQFKKGEFDGSCDADMWHAYACWDVGIQIDAKICTGSRLIGENCAKEGILIGATRACNLSSISSFDANNPDIMKIAGIKANSLTFNIKISSGFHVINGIRIYDRKKSLGGLLLERHQVCVSGLIVDGHGNSGTGLEVLGGQNRISGLISNYSGSGGIGVSLSPPVRLCDIQLNTDNCHLAIKDRGASANIITLLNRISGAQMVCDTVTELNKMNKVSITTIRDGKIVPLKEGKTNV